MKNKIIILSIVIILLLSGCSKSVVVQNNQRIFEIINKRLVYDAETKIIYIVHIYIKDIPYNGICPYYSENGKLCRYNEETNTIEEVK